ncbi:MAG: ABC transporter permease [Christensenellaceae bacterium]|nr:ABC transporter permease [Christensenellaceae bacterium]MBR3843357.1 ABC transporter permease [Christensenellaceae bacterium]
MENIQQPNKWKAFYQNNNTQITLCIALLALCAVGAITSPHFFEGKNWNSIMTGVSIVGTMSAGLTVSMILGGLDVSQYAILAFTGIMFAIFVVWWKWNFWLGVLGVIVLGVVIGLWNAFVVCGMKVEPMVATMGTQFICRGFAFIVTDAANQRVGEIAEVNYIGTADILGIPFCFWFMMLAYVFVYIMLKYTKFGRDCYAVGANSRAAYLSGISLTKVRTRAYIFSSLLASLTTILYVGQVGSALVAAGNGLDLDASTAVILGGLSVAGGKGNVVGSFLGCLFLTILQNIFSLNGVTQYWQTITKGFVLVIAVALDTLRGGGQAQY